MGWQCPSEDQRMGLKGCSGLEVFSCRAWLSLHSCRDLMERLLLPSKHAIAAAASPAAVQPPCMECRAVASLHRVQSRAQTGQNGVVGLVIDPLPRSRVCKSPDGCADCKLRRHRKFARLRRGLGTPRKLRLGAHPRCRAGCGPFWLGG